MLHACYARCACCAGEYELHEDHLDWEGLQAEYDKLPEREKERCACCLLAALLLPVDGQLQMSWWQLQRQ